MKWFEGSIAEAVKAAKERNAIFTVFIEGSDSDSLSTKLRGFIEDQIITGRLETESFVTIKIIGGSQDYIQFCKIYQIVPVPSLFFIGQSGSPLEIATGIIESVDELEKKVISALAANGLAVQETNNAISTPLPPASTSHQETEVVCNDGVCYLKPRPEGSRSTQDEQSQPNTPPPTPVTTQPPELEPSIHETKPSENNTSTQEQLKKRLEEIKVQKEVENRNEEKEREIQRRKDGKQLQTIQEKQKEMEYRELKENLKREKKQEQEARQKILNQIANDRKERAQKMNPEKEATSSATANQTIPVPKSIINSDQTKLQFRVPNGESHSNIFASSTKFSEIRDYVKNTVLQNSGISNFTLVTTYPRKEFTFDDDTQTLLDLGLTPSGVILVVVKAGSAAAVIARTGGFVNMFNTLFWGILTPVFAVLGYLKGALFGGGDVKGNRPKDSFSQKRSNEEEISANDLAKKRNLDRFTGVGSSIAGTSSSTSQSDNVPYRRAGSNIHRLADQKDDDDDNATWNGNSTQQQ